MINVKKYKDFINEDVTNESPLQKLIDKMFLRINETDVKTKKLADIIKIAFECREGLLEGEEDSLPENIWWVHKAIEDFTEIIVRANRKAHRILNGDIVPEDCEDEVKEEIEKIRKKFKK